MSKPHVCVSTQFERFSRCGSNTRSRMRKLVPETPSESQVGRLPPFFASNNIREKRNLRSYRDRRLRGSEKNTIIKTTCRKTKSHVSFCRTFKMKNVCTFETLSGTFSSERWSRRSGRPEKLDLGFGREFPAIPFTLLSD